MENEQPKPKTTPRDFFLNLGAMLTLYVAVVNFINLLFSMIDKILPDKTEYNYDPYSSGVRMAIAFLIIIFPLHMFLMRMLRKDFSLDPERKKVGIRKWLVFLTLFIAGGAISVDLIMLVSSFLEGELTLRFALKVISVFLVSYFIIKYYIFEIKDTLTDAISKKFEIIATLAVILSIIGGFYVMGSPFTQRMRKFDDMRINDLQSIQWQIVNYWQQKGIIPTKLSDLTDSISGFTAPVDPDTAGNYNYKISSATTFKLCANFDLASDETKISIMPEPYGMEPGSSKRDNWSHKEGLQCFERSIDSELYPIRKK